MHALVMEPRIGTIRVHSGRIEYNPAFIASLKARQLEAVLQFEALRILLRHPYSRCRANAELTYVASNLTLQEHLRTELPFPCALDIFGTDEFDRQYLEFYYSKLLEQAEASGAGQGGAGAGDETENASGGTSNKDNDAEEGGDNDTGEGGGMDDSPAPGTLDAYADSQQTGKENVEEWGPDDFLMDRMDGIIRAADENQSWGSLAGGLRERILATLRPRLDYRSVLRQFRTSILSSNRILTRMKPNRRYGFQYLGSRWDFVTRLLVAVDVSGSMSSKELEYGFSLINQFFKYGVPFVDVIQFDTEIKGPPLTLKRARHEVQVIGRGGTDFSPLMDYLDGHWEYDGLIIFTDGGASVPRCPKNRRTRILWLFNHESNYQSGYPPLKHLGKAAFIKPDAI
ncbi:MAG: hypothetical protein GY862_17305 [Gammaproteobacteria bacterium]|nr:hypothetical protein [Gammaproteobacteria bacterium]